MTGTITRKKFFNTAGLCFPEDHYMVDPLKRIQEVVPLIEKKLYFTLHAPRQTGKTTYLHALARKLNAEGNKKLAWLKNWPGTKSVGTKSVAATPLERGKM